MPVRRTAPRCYEQGRRLRKAPTVAESRLWTYLRRGELRGVSIRRQHAIGRYVVDFCSPRHKLVIELDGSPHTASANRDAARTTFLESRGYRVLRFWNSDVLKDGAPVMRAILDALNLVQ